jgi:hypothetical protein
MFPCKVKIEQLDRTNKKVKDADMKANKALSKGKIKKVASQEGERTPFYYLADYFESNGKPVGDFLSLGNSLKLEKHFIQNEMKKSNNSLMGEDRQDPKKACMGEIYVENSVIHFVPNEKSKVPVAKWAKIFKEMKEYFSGMKAVVVIDGEVLEEGTTEGSMGSGEEEVLIDDNIEGLGDQISSEAKSIVNNISSHFSTADQPSLKPLAKILTLSKTFWAQMDVSQDDNAEALLIKLYAVYADLEKAMYDHWIADTNMDKAYVDFIESKIVKVFYNLFRGKGNTANGDYGSGKKLNAFAKSYTTYQEINEISTDINKLAGKYENSEDLKVDINKLGGLVEDTKTLLKGGYKLKELIKLHYKNSDICKQLFEALGNWESARAEMMEQFTPHLKSYYNVFKSTLTQKDTANEIKKESISLLKSMANIEKILPKFAEMDEFRKKIEKLDTEKHLSQELEAIKKVEAQLIKFVEEMKQMTTDWVNQDLKLLVQCDDELVQLNALLETEKTNLNTRANTLQKKKAASGSTDWETFWSTNDQEKADLETLLKTLDAKLKDSSQKRKELNSAFSSTYERFAKIMEQV